MKEITGDLIKQDEQFDIIVHGCNCFCTMQCGIAPQIKSKWPEAYEADLQTVKGERQKLGTISYTTSSPIVVNAYTQYQYGRTKRHCDYEAIASCMKAIKSRFPGRKIGMPKIGAGLAGGDWEIIKTIIATELKEEDVTIVKWEKA